MGLRDTITLFAKTRRLKLRHGGKERVYTYLGGEEVFIAAEDGSEDTVPLEEALDDISTSLKSGAYKIINTKPPTSLALTTKVQAIDREYTIEKRLGSGAQATVYKATRKRDGMVVTIKVYTSKEPITKELIQQEVEVLKRLRTECAYTVCYVDYFSTPELALITEYAEGQDLSTLSNVTTELAESILGQILTALRFIHARAIAHRDIKPSNVVYDSKTNRVRLIDFGLSCFVCSCARVPGTPSYMDPHVSTNIERYRNDKTWQHLWQKADIYSTGVTVYNLVVSKHYDPKQDSSRQVANIKEEDIRDIVKDCLIADPYKRPTAGEILVEYYGVFPEA